MAWHALHELRTACPLFLLHPFCMYQREHLRREPEKGSENHGHGRGEACASEGLGRLPEGDST